jgi:hypothetical protein
MNEIPPPNEGPDEVDERYRRLSDREPVGPSETVRRAVLRHAAELAGQVKTEGKPPAMDAAKRARWRVASYGGLAAAAALAGFLVAPHFLTPAPPTMARQSLGAPSSPPPASVALPVPAPPLAAPAAPAAGEAADAQRATEMPEVAQDSVVGGGGWGKEK